MINKGRGKAIAGGLGVGIFRSDCWLSTTARRARPTTGRLVRTHERLWGPSAFPHRTSSAVEPYSSIEPSRKGWATDQRTDVRIIAVATCARLKVIMVFSSR